MRPQKLEFFGLFNFGDNQTVNFADFRDTDCVYILGGHDGGKDIIADLIIYALFGKTSEGEPERFIINKRAKSAGIKLSFEHGGAEYELERTFFVIKGKKYAATDAKLYRIEAGDRAIEAEGAPSVLKSVKAIVGADAARYKKSQYVNIYNAFKLFTMTDEEQLKYFKDELNISETESRLSKGINDKITELKVRQAAIESGATIPEETKNALLSEYREKLDGMERQASELKEKKVELLEKAERRKAVEDINARYNAINAEIEELKSQKEYFDGLEKKIKISDKASNILPAYKRREELLSENQELALKRDGLISDIAQKDAEIEAEEIAEEALKDEYELLYSEYSTKKERFKDSIDENSDINIKVELEESIKKDKEDLAEIVKKRQELIQRLSEVNAECDGLRKKINELAVDPELNFDISKSNALEGTLKRLLKERYYLERKTAELDDKINAATQVREFVSAKILAIEDEINALQKEKYGLIGEGDIYTVFTREYLKYNKLSHQVGKVDTYNDNLKQLTKKKKENAAKIEHDTLELDRAEALKSNAETNLYNINSKSDIAAKERERVSNVNYFVGVSNGVRVGEFCPICNNVLTLKQPKNSLPMVPVDLEASKLRDDRIKAEEILANSLAIIAGLKSNILHYKNQNNEFDRDEAFYIDCINDILREEDFESVQLLYEAFLRQKEKYEEIRLIYERAGAIILAVEKLKDDLRDAEIEFGKAEKEISIYSEQYNERKYALQNVDVDYERQLGLYTSLNSLSEYDTPEKILAHVEEMASQRSVFEKEYEEKTETKRELEGLIAECDNLEVLLFQKAGAGEPTRGTVSYSELIVDAITGRYYEQIYEILSISEKLNAKRVDIDESRKRTEALKAQKQQYEIDLSAAKSAIDANDKQIENFDNTSVTPIDGVLYNSEEDLDSLIMTYFVHDESETKLNEYKVRLNDLIAERDGLAALTAECENEETTDELTAQAEEIAGKICELSKQAVIVEFERKHLEAKTAVVGDGTDSSNTTEELNSALKLNELIESGVYGNYIAEQNAAQISASASRVVAAATNGRYALEYNDGLRVKDKLFDDKYRTLATLDEKERMTIGLAVIAALAKTQADSKILFIDGFDLVGGEYTEDFKVVVRALKESFDYIAVLVREGIENSGAVINVKAEESGNAVLTDKE
ncbi:MAG: AAA family ATPase [Clostridiales bacterium]|jgi:hypothetical protein|nr:AAA family ATPase [Clostridiales bacterium]